MQRITCQRARLAAIGKSRPRRTQHGRNCTFLNVQRRGDWIGLSRSASRCGRYLSPLEKSPARSGDRTAEAIDEILEGAAIRLTRRWRLRWSLEGTGGERSSKSAKRVSHWAREATANGRSRAGPDAVLRSTDAFERQSELQCPFGDGVETVQTRATVDAQLSMTGFAPMDGPRDRT